MRARKVRQNNRKSMVEINIVPYIDVMLVLLVIFMIATPMFDRGVKVNLPKVSANKIVLTPQKPIVITVNNSGQYFINRGKNTPQSVNQLVHAISILHQKNPSQTVYVRGDKDSKYGKVVYIMAYLQKAGIKKLGLVTNDKKSN